MSFASSLSWQDAQKRSDLMFAIRSFFRQKNVLEVETPVLSQGAPLDPFIDVFETESFLDGSPLAPKQKLFLQTSPEYHMKRLLASGYQDIFQICKAFRSGETGPRHSWEFSILEWYRIDWSIEKLMEEVFSICQLAAPLSSYTSITYLECFLKYLNINPFTATLSDLKHCAIQNKLADLEYTEKDDWLNYLLGSLIEPLLGKSTPTFLTHYPSSQAALAKTTLDEHNNSVALRFELYIDGIEMCNGFQELTNAKEQQARFDEDQQKRILLNKRPLTQDLFFLEALEHGMPECSGVALGLDRLLMWALHKKDLKQITSFSFDNC